MATHDVLDLATGTKTQRESTPEELTAQAERAANPPNKDYRPSTLTEAMDDPDGINRMLFKLLLKVHNRVRVLEGKPTHTLADLKQLILADL